MSYPDVYPPDSYPHGKSYADWLELYTIKLLEAPEDENPAYDSDGRYCDRMQEEQVFLLAGSFDGQYNRQFSIEEGKDLFLAPIFKNDSHAEDNDLAAEDDNSMIQRLNEGISYVTEKFVIVDEKPVENVDDFLVTTRIFPFTFPENNVYKVTPGLTTGIAKGWAVMLKALPVGQHTVEFGGVVQIPETSIIFNQLQKTRINMSTVYEINVSAVEGK
jgi:hypothetical protein